MVEVSSNRNGSRLIWSARNRENLIWCFKVGNTAAKDKEENNYSVCTTWGKKDQNLYLLHVLRRRMDYPELKRSVTEQATRFKATTVLIEDKSSGTPLIQELRREGSHAIKAYQPKIDKKTRMHSVTSTIEGGFVHLPDKASWLADYLHEMITFPRGRYDDLSSLAKNGADFAGLGRNH